MSDSSAASAERAVRNWNERIEEHRSTIPESPAQLQMMKPRSASAEHKQRKRPVNHKRTDDQKTDECVRIANYYVTNSQQHQPPAETAGVFPSIPVTSDRGPIEPAAITGSVFRLHSNAQSLDKFSANWRLKQQQQLQASIERQHQTIVLNEEVPDKDVVFSSTQREVDLNFLSGYSVLDRMKSMFDQNTRYHVTTVNKEVPDPITMPVDSAHHIRRLLLLYTPSRPFAPCSNGLKFGACQSQYVVRHPAAPDMPMMAYYSEADYTKVCLGETLPANFSSGGPDTASMGYQNICELCYRAFIAESVEESKHNNHEVAAELPSRYYQIGPGGYSQDGMHQQATLKKATFSHGIIGCVRDWNIKDFVPGMFVLSSDNAEILETLHYEEYIARLERGSLIAGRSWIPGLIETGPFYVENEASLRPVKQTNPYTYTFVTTARSPSVGHMLEDCFSDIASIRFNSDKWAGGIHLFWDIMRCWNDPGYLQRPAYKPKEGRWKGFCLHNFANPPDIDTHKIYYIVLHKINTLRRLIKPKNPLKLIPYFIQKIQVYILSYHPLLDYLETTQDYSDVALLSRIYPEPRLGVVTTALAYFYPLPIYHHRNGDLAHYKMAVHRYSRNNPLTNCVNFYNGRAQERVDTPETCLHKLPHKYEQMTNYAEVIAQLGPITALESYESVVQDLKALFVQNTLEVKVFGMSFKWKECTVKKQRRQALKQDLLNESLPEKQKIRQRKAVIRTLKSVCDSVNNNFKQVQDWVDTKTQRYLHLLNTHAEAVFCSFERTMAHLREADMVQLLAEFGGFQTLLPDTIKLTLGVEFSSWVSHRILLALLFRVAVLEELYDLEPHDRTHVRHNLVLLRNAHLRLFRRIFNNPHIPMTDAQLQRPLHHGTKLTALQYYYPHPEREIHSGQLPDYSDRLEMVDFFSTSGMDIYPWNRLHKKMPDRCCRVRDFASMVKTMCGDTTLYRWTILVLRLSLCGLYEHCKVSPSFARTIILDELFDENNASTLKPTMLEFVTANKDVVLNALSESLCYQLELKPSLLAMLNRIHHDLFDWRIKANGDMTRKIFTSDGNFISVLQVIFQRVHLKSMRTIFRLSETNFVIWICSAFKHADDMRHKSNQPCLPDTAAIDPTIDAAIQNLILQLNPRQKIDVRVLTLFRIDEEQLFTLADLNKVFSVQLLQTTDQPIPLELKPFDLSTRELVAMIHSIPSEQYVILWHFFNLLKNYQAVRTIPIRNAALLEKQQIRIQERASVTEDKKIQRFASCCAFSLCCRHVKNSWSHKPGTPSIGFEDIYYDMENGIMVCAKKPHQLLEGEDGVSTTSKRKIDRELRRPICARTEPFHIFLPGLLVEADGYKIPGTKRASLNETAAAAAASATAATTTTATPAPTAAATAAAAKKPSFALPLPGYWVNPCCGLTFEYDFTRWTPAGYQCRFSTSCISMFNSFLELNCQICHIRIKEIYYLHRVFDDVMEMRPIRMVFCKDCNFRVRNQVERFPLLSFLVTKIRDNETAVLLMPR